jgi:hypothetical protein
MLVNWTGVEEERPELLSWVLDQRQSQLHTNRKSSRPLFVCLRSLCVPSFGSVRACRSHFDQRKCKEAVKVQLGILTAFREIRNTRKWIRQSSGMVPYQYAEDQIPCSGQKVHSLLNLRALELHRDKPKKQTVALSSLRQIYSKYTQVPSHWVNHQASQRLQSSF